MTSDVRHLITLASLTREDVEHIFDRAVEYKADRYNHPQLANRRTLALLFERPSTRTRLSFQIAVSEMGGFPVCMEPSELCLSKGEPLEDTAKVFNRFVHAVVARVMDHKMLVRWASLSTVPIINGLDDHEHPCQGLTDLFTIREKLGGLSGACVAFLGDCEQNTAAGLELACAKLGVDFVAICPPEYQPRPEIQQALREHASLTIIHDPAQGVRSANVLYTDIWVNPGFEDQANFRYEALRPYQLNEALLSKARRDVLVMHNLPARRGEEITDGVLRSPNCIVFDQAENRLHVQKGILHWAWRLE